MCRIGTPPESLPLSTAAAQPSGLFAPLGRPMPDVHRLEVRALRVRVADALHDRQLSLSHIGRSPDPGMQPDVVVQADDDVLVWRVWAGLMVRSSA